VLLDFGILDGGPKMTGVKLGNWPKGALETSERLFVGIVEGEEKRRERREVQSGGKGGLNERDGK